MSHYPQQPSHFDNDELEIVQEGLQLKLDMQNVKEEFLGVLEGYHNYENYDEFDHLFMDHEGQQRHLGEQRVPPVNTQQIQPNYNADHPLLSDPRARVRALYEARKARMHARRDRLDTPLTNLESSSQPHTNWPGVQYSYPHPDDEQKQHNSGESYQKPQTTPTSGSDHEDRNNNTPTKSPKENRALHDHSSSSSDPPYVNVLSTISEENSLSSKNSSGNNPDSSKSEVSEADIPVVPPRRPLIPKNRYREYLSEKAVPKPGGWQDLGEYVTLKAPNQSIISFSDSNLGAPAPSMLKPDMMSQSLGASMFSVAGNELGTFKKEHDTSKESTSVRYAKSNVISELYTSQHRERASLDVSCISSISSASSADGTVARLSDSGACDYPLHSTVLGASIHSPVLPVSLSETDEDSLMNRTDDTLETVDTYEGEGRQPHDTRTTVSEPSAVLHQRPKLTVFQPPKAFDDCYIQSKNNSIANKSAKTPTYRRSKHSGTPKQSQIPQLCSEHGLHLNYGGPCIFEDSFNMLGSSDESDIDFSSVNFNSESGSKLSSKRSSLASKRSSVASKISSKRSSVVHHNSVADTDCDSSYLSECVDDTHFTNDFSEAENYTALYDSRHARMKILRRQTGHGDIKRHRKPVGLSESDLIHDMSERHLSLRATRSSMPDIHNLSPTSSFSSHDQKQLINYHHLDSSLHDSTLKSNAEHGYSSQEEDDDEHFNSLSHNDTVVSGYSRSDYIADDIDSRSEPRPVSLCTSTTGTTTTDDSPESNGGMTVPVNSPNITDSGGSSSRPTTDAYDYVDVPINIPKVAQLLKNKLSIQQQQLQYHHQQHNAAPTQLRPNQSVASQGGRRLYTASSAGSQHSGRSQRSRDSHIAHSDPLLNTQTASHSTTHREDMRRHARSPQRYPRSQDSGFATHESAWSHHNAAARRQAARAHSYDSLQQPEQPLAHSCHTHSSHKQKSRGGHIAISNEEGVTRTVVQHSAVARHMNKDRKKALAKKLKQFNNNFYGSKGHPQIKTLGHF